MHYHIRSSELRGAVQGQCGYREDREGIDISLVLSAQSAEREGGVRVRT